MNDLGDHSWTMPEPPQTPAWRSGLSTKALLTSLFAMCAAGAVALFALHSAVCDHRPTSHASGVAELQSTAAPVATIVPLAPTAAPAVASTVSTVTSAPSVSDASIRMSTAAPRVQLRPKTVPRSHLQTFARPVHVVVESNPSRSDLTVPPPRETSITTPYDEPSGTVTTDVPSKVTDSPSENALDSRE
jgi:hypothetical protein